MSDETCPHCAGSDLGPGFLPSDWPCSCSLSGRDPSGTVRPEMKQQLVVGVAGYAGAGKDTVADILVEDFGFEKMSFADPLREMALAIDPIIGLDYSWDKFGTVVRYSQALEEVGYNEAKFKYPEIRQFLQRLGTDAVRNVIGHDTWTYLASKRVQEAFERGVPGVVFADVRFRNEAEELSKYGSVIRVERPGIGPAGDHVSEHDLDGYDFHRIIQNDGTIDDLRAKLTEIYG